MYVAQDLNWRQQIAPVCGQCWRPLVPTIYLPGLLWDDWQHRDGTVRCPQGTHDAVRGLLTLRVR